MAGREGRAVMADCATQEDQCHPRKIFVGGLAHKTSTQHLRDYFASYGSIVDAVVLRWPDGRSRGFGYVTFADATSANAVLQASHQVGGRQVDVKRAVPGTNKLFVGGLPQNTTAAELREHFEAYGVVSDAVVMIDPANGRSRGFGFVCFLPGQEGATAVTMALEQYQNHRLRGKWIEVKNAAPPHKLAAKAEEEEALAIAQAEKPPMALSEVASPSRRRMAPKPVAELEPQKVSLAMPPGLGMGPPPGLGLFPWVDPAFMPPFGFFGENFPLPFAYDENMPFNGRVPDVKSLDLGRSRNPYGLFDDGLQRSLEDLLRLQVREHSAARR